jgi:hypothetical protein
MSLIRAIYRKWNCKNGVQGSIVNSTSQERMQIHLSVKNRINNKASEYTTDPNQAENLPRSPASQLQFIGIPSKSRLNSIDQFI